MPKQKTNRGAAKRFKPTKNGYKCKSANTRHILTKKSQKLKRQNRGLSMVAKADQLSVARMLLDK